jgi:hypothetical protein
MKSLEQKERVELMVGYLEWALAWVEDESVVYEIVDISCDGWILYALWERCDCNKDGLKLTANELRYYINEMIYFIKDGDINDKIEEVVIGSKTLTIKTKKGYVKIKKKRKKML